MGMWEPDDAARRDPREMRVWDWEKENEGRWDRPERALESAFVAFQHPKASGSVMITGTVPSVRLTEHGSSGGHGNGAPWLSVNGAPSGFGAVVEWGLAKAVERYDVLDRLGDDPTLDVREVMEASAFDLPEPRGCRIGPGRGEISAKLKLAGEGDESAKRFMRRFTERSELVELVVQSDEVGQVQFTIDGRNLPVDISASRCPQQGQWACWALREAGVHAQRWGNQVFASLTADSPTPGGIVVDFTHGLPDRRPFPGEDEDARELFLLDFFCGRSQR